MTLFLSRNACGFTHISWWCRHLLHTAFTEDEGVNRALKISLSSVFTYSFFDSKLGFINFFHQGIFLKPESEKIDYLDRKIDSLVSFCLAMLVIVLFLKLTPVWYYSSYVILHWSQFNISKVVKFVSFQPGSTSSAFEIASSKYPYFKIT